MPLNLKSYNNTNKSSISFYRISKEVDFFNVLTFNMHGHGESFADHHSPLKIRDFENTSPNPISTVNQF